MEVFKNVTLFFRELSSADVLQKSILAANPIPATFLFDVEEKLSEAVERVDRIIKEKATALRSAINYLEKLYADLMHTNEPIFICEPPIDTPTFFQSIFYQNAFVDPTSVSAVPLRPLPQSSCINVNLASIFDNLVFTDSFPKSDFYEEPTQKIYSSLDEDGYIIGNASATTREANVYPRASFQSYLDLAVFSYPRVSSFATTSSIIDQEKKKFAQTYNQITSTDTSVPAGIMRSKIHSAHYNLADTFFIVLLSDCEDTYTQTIYPNSDILYEQLVDFPEMFTRGQLKFSYNLLGEQEIYRYDDVDYPGIDLVAETLYVNVSAQQKLLKTSLQISVDIAQSIIEAKSGFSSTGVVFVGWNSLFPLKSSYKVFTGPSDVYLDFMNSVVRNISAANHCLIPTLFDLYEALHNVYVERVEYLSKVYQRRNPLYTKFESHYRALDNSAQTSPQQTTRIRPLVVYILGSGISTNNQSIVKSTSSLKLISELLRKMKKINIQIIIIAIPPDKDSRKEKSVFNKRMLHYEQFCWLRRLLLPRAFHVFDIDDYVSYMTQHFSSTSIWFHHRDIYFRHIVERYLSPLRSKNSDIYFSAPYLNLHGSSMVSFCGNVFVDLVNLPKNQHPTFNHTLLVNTTQTSSKFIIGSVCVELPMGSLVAMHGLAHKTYRSFLLDRNSLSILGSTSRYKPFWQYFQWSVMESLPKNAADIILLREQGLIELDLHTGYIVYYKGRPYNNSFTLDADLPTDTSPYPLINRTRYLFFQQIPNRNDLVLLVSLNFHVWDYPLALRKTINPPLDIEYLLCGNDSPDSATFYTVQTVFSKAYKNTGKYTQGLSQSWYSTSALCSSMSQLVRASPEVFEMKYNASLVGALGLNPSVLRFARFAADNSGTLRDCYNAFNAEATGVPGSVSQCIFLDLSGNVLAYPSFRCTNTYSKLIQNLLNQPVARRISFHRSSCMCSTLFYDSGDPVILDDYDTYLYNFTCVSMVIRLYSKSVPDFLDHPEVVGFFIVTFTDHGLKRLYTKKKAEFVAEIAAICPNYDPSQQIYQCNNLMFIDLHTADIYIDDFSSLLIDAEKIINPHVSQMQYLLWYHGFLQCVFRQYHDKVLRTMAASKALEDIYTAMIFRKKDMITYDVYSRHLQDAETVKRVKNKVVLGLFYDISGVAVDATYLSLNVTPSVGCKRELEDSGALLAYYPQANTLSLAYSDAYYTTKDKAEFIAVSIYSELEQKVLFPLLISVTVLLLLFTLLKTIFRRTPVAYRLRLHHVTGR